MLINVLLCDTEIEILDNVLLHEVTATDCPLWLIHHFWVTAIAYLCHCQTTTLQDPLQ